MPDKVVSIELRAKVDGAVAGFKKAKASVDDLTKAASPSKADAFGKLADKAALAGVGVATAVGVAVKRFADFDQAMSAVKANSGATGAEFDKLRALAIKLGADSQFSAKEAADGINELAKAGVGASDIIGGGLKGSLDLAAAGQIGVADAAETAATAMTQFKLSGDKVPHIADLLANAANKAQGGVGDMAQALKQAGLVAASTGLSIEETTAGLTAFAAAGLIGSDAGTSFKTMLQRLSAPSTEAQKAMDKLGITAYDSQGNFIGLANVAQLLQDKLKDLTPEQRNAALATIFGSDAIRAANVLYDQGAAGINKWTKEVSEQGAAARQAATLTDNLKGDIERLGGALDSVFIQTGSSANGSLRMLVQGVTGLVDYVGKIPGPLLLAGGALSAFALLAPKGVLEYRKYKAQLDSVGLSLDKISAKAPRTGAALERTATGAKRAGAALAVAAATVGALDQAFGKHGDGLGVQGLTKDLLASDDAVKTFSARIKTYADSQSNWFNGDAVTSYGAALKAAFDPSIYQNIDNAVGSLVGVSTDVENANARLRDLDQVLTGLAQGGQAQKADALFQQFAAAAKESGVSVDQLKSKLPGYTEALAGAANQAGTAGQKQVDLGDNLEQVQTAAAEAKDALDKYVEGLQNAGLVVLSTRAAQRDLKQSIVDAKKALEDNGKTLDINTEKGRNNSAALDAVAQNALDLADAIYKETGSEDKMRASLVSSRKSLVDTAIRFGMTKAEANKYADSVLKIPAAKHTKVTFQAVGISDLKAAGEYLKGLHDKHVTLTVGTVKVGNTRVNAGQFAEGGYTGDGGKYEPKGIVHGGEFVFTKAQTATIGKATLAYFAKNARLPGYAEGGYVGSRRAPASLAPQVIRVPVGAGAPTITQDIRTDDPARAAALAVAGITWAMRTP